MCVFELACACIHTHCPIIVRIFKNLRLMMINSNSADKPLSSCEPHHVDKDILNFVQAHCFHDQLTTSILKKVIYKYSQVLLAMDIHHAVHDIAQYNDFMYPLTSVKSPSYYNRG